VVKETPVLNAEIVMLISFAAIVGKISPVRVLGQIPPVQSVERRNGKE